MFLRNTIKQFLNIEQRVAHPKSADILEQQIDKFYAQSKPGLILSITVITITSFFLGTIFDNPYYAYFAVGVVVSAVSTYAYILHDEKKSEQSRSSIYRGNILSLFNLSSGLFWGLFFAIGLDTSNESLTFLSVFMVVSMLTGATSVLSYYLLAYLAFSISLVTPITIVLISTQSDGYILLGALLPTALLAGYGYARTLGNTAVESFQLRFEKEDLVKELTLQKNEADRLRQEADNANTAKSKFLAAASHDLRQPLHALILFTEALDVDKDNLKQTRLVGNIKNSVNAMESLFNALLDISRLDAGIIQPDITDFSLNDFIQPLYAEFSSSYKSSEIQFDCVKTQAVVKTDAALLEAIVRNLLGNAFRYTQQGNIWITIESHEESLLLEIGDTGIGIPEDQLKKIFDEYYQLTNPDRDREKGLGLGLAIVKKLVNILHLKIDVNSRIDHGSQFAISIPLGDHSNIKPATKDLDPALISHNSINVLVIDDDKMVRDSLSAILTKWDYRHRTAESTDEAINIIQNENFLPGAILADYQLKHNKTGIESIQRIRELTRSKIPAIIMTGDILPAHLTEVEKSELPVLYKPVKPTQLRQFLLHSEPSAQY